MEPTTLTISSVGQITIPRRVREFMGIKAGARLDIEVDEEDKTIVLKPRKTHEEIFSELEAFHKTLPKPDPRSKDMSVGEMSLEGIQDIEGDTWV